MRQASSILRFVVVIAVLASTAIVEAQSKTGPDRRVAHILTSSEAKCDEIMKLVSEGREFSELAIQYSFDVPTKRTGGDLGWIARGGYDADFTKAAWSIEKIGETTKVKTQFGWHVIILKETSGEQPKPAEQVDPAQIEAAKDLQWTFAVTNPIADSYADFEFFIEVRNVSGKPQEVFHPQTWPLGLVVQRALYKGGNPQMAVTLPDRTAKSISRTLSRMLPPGASLKQTYRLSSYVGPVPDWTLYRARWRASNFLFLVEETFPEVDEQVPDFPIMRRSWRRYATEEEINFNKLPRYEDVDRWFAQMWVRGPIWFELAEPEGAPELLREWMGLVRTNAYRKVPLREYKVDYGFRARGPRISRDEPQKFRLPKGYEPKPVPAGRLALELNNDNAGIYATGDYVITTGDIQDLRLIEIGKLFGEPQSQAFIDGMKESFLTRGRRPSTLLATVYPANLLPEAVAEVAGVELVEEESPNATGENATDPKGESAEAPTAGDNPAPAKPRNAGDGLPIVRFETSEGVFEVELFVNETTNSVMQFLTLVNDGFYNGQRVHYDWNRFDSRGWFQVGSPTGERSGRIDYTVADEESKRSHVRGTVSLCRIPGVADSASSQILVCKDDLPSLDGNQTIIGRVTAGMSVVDSILTGASVRRVVIDREPSEWRKPLPAGRNGNR